MWGFSRMQLPRSGSRIKYFVYMASQSKHFRVLFPALFIVALLAASGSFAQERADCRMFRSAVLNSSVRYCVFLPASYSTAAANAQKDPHLYLLHVVVR